MLISKALTFLGITAASCEPTHASPTPDSAVSSVPSSAPPVATSVATDAAGIAPGRKMNGHPKELGASQVVPQVVTVFVPEDEPYRVPRRGKRTSSSPRAKHRLSAKLGHLSPGSQASRVEFIALDHARRLVALLNKNGIWDIDLLVTEMREQYAKMCAADDLEPVKDQTITGALLRINGRRKSSRRLSNDRRERAYFIPKLWSAEDDNYFAERSSVGAPWKLTLKAEAGENFREQRGDRRCSE